MAQTTIEWAALNQADPAGCVGIFADKALDVAGPGAPLVSEFALMEYAADPRCHHECERVRPRSAGSSSSATATSLPRLWGRVLEGRLPGTCGPGTCRSAGSTAHTSQPLPAAEPCSRRWTGTWQPVAHSCSWAKTGPHGLGKARASRYRPGGRRSQEAGMAAERRHVDVHTDQVSGFDGTVRIGHAEVRSRPHALDASKPRSRAGAKQQADRPAAPSPSTSAAPKHWAIWRRRRLATYRVRGHRPRSVRERTWSSTISEDALTGSRDRRQVRQHQIPDQRRTGPRVVRQPGSTPRHRQAESSIWPAHIHVEAYETPDRLKEAERSELDVTLRVSRTAPNPAMRCDTDHVVAYPRGQTSSTNTAPLCRRHHRAKTHSPFDYEVLDRGTYLWTTPNGLRLIRDHRGTSSVPGEP